MKVKTSITIEKDTLRALDRIGHGSVSRSRLIQEAVDALVAKSQREARDRRDLEILNRRADAMNREMEAILAVQEDL